MTRVRTLCRGGFDLKFAAVSLALLAMVQIGCATATAPGPAGVSGSPGRAGETEQAPSGDPRDTQARASLEIGRAAIARGDMVAATIALREALRLQPELVEARVSLARALYDMGDRDGAVEELRAMRRQRYETGLARMTLAAALMARHDWSSARAELEEVVRTQPELIQAHYSLGLARYALGDLNGAIEAYRQVLARSPGHADARYNLALTLKLAHRDAEATPEFLGAAQAGHGVAQYFLGAAYASGVGVERNLAVAIMWWSRAERHGVDQASVALGELRWTALGRGRRAPAERQAIEQAFQDYRSMLWAEFPELAQDGVEDTVGAALLRQGRGREAVTILIGEANALSEAAQGVLEALYYHGVKGQLRAHDERILRYFQTAAAEGQVRPRIALARFYAVGLGVPKDIARAIGLLKSTPHEDAQRLLQELTAASEAGPAPARP